MGYERVDQAELDSFVKLHRDFMEGRMGGRRMILKNKDLSGLSLKGKDLRQASITSCLMQQMNLSGANFREASLYACDLTNANLTNTIFIRSDLRGSRIESVDLTGANLDSADLRVGGISDDGEFANMQGTKVIFKVTCACSLIH